MTMKKTTMALMLVSGSMMLGGCQQFHSLFAGSPARAETASVDMSGYFEARLEAGRNHLMRNRPAQAVTAFRQASYNAGTAASAYNGMAIAYAQIGRDDLARQYFMAAMQADPGDERYVRNLARLDGGLPSDEQEGALAQVDANANEPVPEAAVPSPSGVDPVAAPTPLRRVSDREVTIDTRAENSTSRTVPVRVLSRGEGTVVTSARVTVEGQPASPTVRQDYPVRVALADVPQRSRSGYPIRIELPEAK